MFVLIIRDGDLLKAQMMVGIFSNKEGSLAFVKRRMLFLLQERESCEDVVCGSSKFVDGS